MEIKLKNITQYIHLDKTCYLFYYELNGSTMTLDYCIGDYFKIISMVTDKSEHIKNFIDKAKSIAKDKGFRTIQYETKIIEIEDAKIKD